MQLGEKHGPAAKENLLLDDLRRLVADEQVVVVVGTGVSVGASGGASVASWTGLLEDGIGRCVGLGRTTAESADLQRAQLQSGELDELLSVAELVASRLDAPAGGEYRRWLRETVGRLGVRQPEVLQALRDLCVPLATTNYDSLIEEVTGLNPVTWRESHRVERVLHGEEPGVLDLHGHWEEPESVVLSIRAYETVRGDEHAQAVLRALRMTRSLLFIGFGAGLADPNFRALLRWSREAFARSEYRQFRLARAGEVTELQKQHPPEERLFVVPYGERHEDLALFLRELGGSLPEPLAEPPPMHGPAPSPPGRRIFHVPRRPSPHFTGRADLLARLDRTLADKIGTAAVVQAVDGLGGVGKSELALKYAHDHRDAYTGVWWLEAEIPPTLASGYAALSGHLGLALDETDQETVIAAVRERLEQSDRRWLLVFDNAGAPADLERYLPRTGPTRVLVTSRQRVWRGLTPDPIAVGLLPPEDAAELLQRRSGRREPEAAVHLAEALGRLPLALEQAAAYIEVNGTTLRGYLDLFRADASVLLEEPDEERRRRATVATTWQITLRALPPATVDLLRLCAFLAPEAIPEDLLRGSANHLSEASPLREALARPTRADAAIGAAHRFSLLDRAEIDGHLTATIHRLLQLVVREQLSPSERQSWAQIAVAIVDSVFPRVEVATWADCAKLLPHAIACLDHLGPAARLQAHAGRLYTEVGRFLHAQGDFVGARRYHEHALAIVEAASEPEHLRGVAVILSNLASALREQGDLAGSRVALDRALSIDEAADDQDPREVGAHLSNLALVLEAQGDLAGARAQLERALPFLEAAGGPDDNDVATALDNLARVLRCGEGDLAGARALQERALAITEAALDASHPTVAIRFNNLGVTLQAQGDLAGARAHHERALAIREAVLPANHPDVAQSLSNLGTVLLRQGDLKGARALLKRALATCEAGPDPEHSRVATCLNRLGMVLEDEGDLAGARACYERAVEIWRRRPSNHNEGGLLHRLGVVAARMGRLEAGLRLLVAGYVVDKRIGHPDAATKALPVVRTAAAALGYDEPGLQALLAEVEAAYERDRGRGLVAAAFPEDD